MDSNIQYLRELNLKETKQKIKESLTDDLILIQAVHSYNELIKAESRLLNVLKDWYGYYFPEITEKEDFTELISQDKNELINKFKIKDSMGSSLSNEDLKPILTLGKIISDIKTLKNNNEIYIENKIKILAPKLSEVATPIIGALLIEKAGSLKHLAELPSSTVQILGAEKSLFRHLRTKTKSPKYGVIFSHPLLTKANYKDKGKTARQIAAKISIAVKQDYFRK
ncbi:hypothetical protein CL617_05275 [archaeon]|nr:hypothetical protein [archaeon]|tara:strand:- start:2798 stop:3472 length:675 start_codon:yes stop_codon:yes gene_type:complete